MDHATQALSCKIEKASSRVWLLNQFVQSINQSKKTMTVLLIKAIKSCLKSNLTSELLKREACEACGCLSFFLPIYRGNE